MRPTRWFIAVLLCTIAQSALAFESLSHPVRSLKFWGDFKKGDLIEKINKTAPAELIDYLRQDNLKNGWPNIPKSVDVSKDFSSDLKSALQEIPRDIRRKINEKLVGLYFVSDLGGSAYTEYVMNETGQEVAGFVVVDITAMNRTANQWATWKESSPFKADEIKIESIIAKPLDDNRRNAIQYILLHEFGHVLSIGSPLVPRWGVDAKDFKIGPEMRFFNLTWKVKDNRFVSHFDESWSDRSKIQYYRPPEKQVTGAVAVDAYKRLADTNFPTLYAVTNPFDDFAESFVNFVHVVRLKKPWRVSVTSKTDKVTVNPCWQDVRCREKRKLIEEILKE